MFSWISRVLNQSDRKIRDVTFPTFFLGFPTFSPVTNGNSGKRKSLSPFYLALKQSRTSSMMSWLDIKLISLAPTKRFCGFDSRLVIGPFTPKTLKMGVVLPCMVLTMKEGSRKITGRLGVSIM